VHRLNPQSRRSTRKRAADRRRFASVEVVPDLDDDVGEIVIKPEDLQVDTFPRGAARGGPARQQDGVGDSGSRTWPTVNDRRVPGRA